MQRNQEVNAIEAGNGAAARSLQQLAFIVGAVRKEQPQPLNPAEPSPAPTSIDWNCVATAETGSDFTMHGSSYSSAYGVMNEAVRENAPADVAARILNGTASPGEQLTMAQSVAAKHGIRAWASSTAARCG